MNTTDTGLESSRFISVLLEVLEIMVIKKISESLFFGSKPAENIVHGTNLNV